MTRTRSSDIGWQPFWRDLATAPNILSLVRLVGIFCVGLLISFQYLGISLIIAVPAALTDYLDGYLARRLDEETRLGALLDSFADLLFALVCLGTAIHYDLWPFYLLLFWGIRDIGVTVLRASAAQQGFEIKSIFLSKLSANINFYSFFLMGIELYLRHQSIDFPHQSLLHYAGLFFIHLGLLLYICAGLMYLRWYIRHYNPAD